MAAYCDIAVGNKFFSFEEVQLAMKRYSDSNYNKFYIRDSRKIDRIKNRVNVEINPELVYYEIKYACFKGGKKFTSKGRGIREFSTVKMECNAHVAFRVSGGGKYLEVKSIDTEHNHAISKEDYPPKFKRKGRKNLLPKDDSAKVTISPPPLSQTISLPQKPQTIFPPQFSQIIYPSQTSQVTYPLQLSQPFIWRILPKTNVANNNVVYNNVAAISEVKMEEKSQLAQIVDSECNSSLVDESQDSEASPKKNNEADTTSAEFRKSLTPAVSGKPNSPHQKESNNSAFVSFVAEELDLIDDPDVLNETKLRIHKLLFKAKKANFKPH